MHPHSFRSFVRLPLFKPVQNLFMFHRRLTQAVFQILSGQNLEYRLRETATEHEQILYWLDQRQPQKAAEAMRVHLKHAKEAAINMMANSKGWKQIS